MSLAGQWLGLHLSGMKVSCTEVTGMQHSCMTAQLPRPDLLLLILGIAAGCMQLKWLAVFVTD